MLASFLNLLFPNVCVGCQNPLTQGEELLCTQCRFELPIFDNFNQSNTQLAEKFYGKVSVNQANAFLKFSQGGMTQRLLHQLKYNNKPEVGLMLGRIFGIALAKVNYQTQIDLIVPVPLHSSKQSSRGYNQCDGFAQGLSEALERPWTQDTLIKTKATASLSKERMDRLGRFETLEKVFEIAKPEAINGQRICLVDDVITSGATLEVCTAELLKSGAKLVNVLGLATKS